MTPRWICRDIDPEHEMFRRSFGQFVDQEITPHHEGWLAAGQVDPELYEKAGTSGFLGLTAPEALGGGGVADYRYSVIMAEELCRAAVLGSGFGLLLHNDTCMPYFLTATPDQQQRWVPRLCSGTAVAAIAMSEPHAGSDLAAIRTVARRDGDAYVLNGSKTFVSNGMTADLVIVAAMTDPEAHHRGMSLFVIEDGMVGFERGRKLAKAGLDSQDTAELFFTNVVVPAGNRLGGEGTGFAQLTDKLARERLTIGVVALAHAEVAFGWALDYAKEREAFGTPIGSFQNSRFALAEMRTELDIARAFVANLVADLDAGTLDPIDAAEAKWWCSEMQQRVLYRCTQLHGGYGYMLEYPIAHAWRDARIQTIYGGTTEIMKEIIGRSLGV